MSTKPRPLFPVCSLSTCPRSIRRAWTRLQTIWWGVFGFQRPSWTLFNTASSSPVKPTMSSFTKARRVTGMPVLQSCSQHSAAAGRYHKGINQQWKHIIDLSLARCPTKSTRKFVQEMDKQTRGENRTNRQADIHVCGVTELRQGSVRHDYRCSPSTTRSTW